MALRAEVSDGLKLVIGQGLKLAFTGVAAGLGSVGGLDPNDEDSAHLSFVVNLL